MTSTLFQNILPEDIPVMLKRLNAYTKSYQRKNTSSMPVILRISSALSNPAPFTSYRTIITATAISPLLSPDSLFGEAFACAGIPYLPVDIVAAEDCTVMFLNGKHC